MSNPALGCNNIYSLRPGSLNYSWLHAAIFDEIIDSMNTEISNRSNYNSDIACYAKDGLYIALSAYNQRHLLIAARDHLKLPDAPAVLEDEQGVADTWLDLDADIEEAPLIVRFGHKAIWFGNIPRTEVVANQKSARFDAKAYAAKILGYAEFKASDFVEAIASLAGPALLDDIRESLANGHYANGSTKGHNTRSYKGVLSPSSIPHQSTKLPANSRVIIYPSSREV